MKKVFRIAAAIIVLALALYLMVTLFFVFIVLAGIGLVYLLFMRFFGKTASNSQNTSGVIIEHEPLAQKDDAEHKNQ
jgi:fatty acid desaturase